MVRVVEVEVVGAETAQGPFDLLHDEPAAQAGAVRATTVGARLEALLHFAGNDDVVAVTLQRHAENFLSRLPLVRRRCAGAVEARLIAVSHRRVEEVNAQVQRPVYELDSVFLLGSHTESSRTQSEARHAHPRASQECIFHGLPSRVSIVRHKYATQRTPPNWRGNCRAQHLPVSSAAQTRAQF